MRFLETFLDLIPMFGVNSNNTQFFNDCLSNIIIYIIYLNTVLFGTMRKIILYVHAERGSKLCRNVREI